MTASGSRKALSVGLILFTSNTSTWIHSLLETSPAAPWLLGSAAAPPLSRTVERRSLGAPVHGGADGAEPAALPRRLWRGDRGGQGSLPAQAARRAGRPPPPPPLFKRRKSAFQSSRALSS